MIIKSMYYCIDVNPLPSCSGLPARYHISHFPCCDAPFPDVTYYLLIQVSDAHAYARTTCSTHNHRYKEGFFISMVITCNIAVFNSLILILWYFHIYNDVLYMYIYIYI